MNVKLALQDVGLVHHSPASPASWVSVVGPVPREFDERSPGSCREATVEAAFDSAKLEVTDRVVVERDVRRNDQVEIVSIPS